MPEPVLVVHGVANRDKAGFAKMVKKLDDSLTTDHTLVPVFWGDLGAKLEMLEYILPDMKTFKDGPPDTKHAVRSVLRGDARSADEPNPTVVTKILEGATRARTRSLADVPSPGERAAVEAALREHVPNTQYIQYADDPEFLRLVGRVVGEGVHEDTATAVLTVPAGAKGGPPGWDWVSGKVQEMLRALDEMAGRLVGRTLGQANQSLRSGVRNGVVSFAGDIVVYHGHQDAIHQRIVDALAHVNEPTTGFRADGEPLWGTKERPISLVAHSLGGVLSFDAAVARKVWIKAFVTFGSQPSFFHAFDPRHGLGTYAPGASVKLPPTIDRWVNLWEPMDLLAFAANPMFVLEGNEEPEDVPVTSGATTIVDSNGQMHGSYWESDELIHELSCVLVLPRRLAQDI